MNLIREKLQSGLLMLDGGMGTQLQARGLAAGDVPEEWNVTHPDAVKAVHAAYFAAGSDIVCTNTFGANRAKYHGTIPLAEVVPAAIALAQDAARAATAADGRPRFVALDVGPTGRLLAPAGDYAFDDAVAAFAEQIALGARAGADLIAIETMGDIRELKAAVLAAKESCDLPIFATVALGEKGTLLTGANVECVAALLDGLRVDALGFNCGLGPDKMLPYVERLVRATTRPVIVKPNAGLPTLVEGRTVFPTGPEEFAADVAALIAAGARVVGGCCGTTPAHLAALAAALPKEVPTRPAGTAETVVSSGTRTVAIPLDDTIVIGERINPTGKKKLKQALVDGDVDYVLREAVAQVEAGAQILDVNVGVPGLDEVAVLDATAQAVQSVVDLPIQIDTSNPVALERALRHCAGKPLVNSVNGTEESLNAVLPLVAKYGGVVVALTLDEAGIPATADGRLAIARKILARGAAYGLTPNDFIIDVLCLAVSAEPTSAQTVLEAVRRVRTELGCRTVLGVSNISFGLPARPLLNSAFYTLALGAGLSAAIINPLSQEMMCAYRAFRALTGRDVSCAAWIAHAPISGVSTITVADTRSRGTRDPTMSTSPADSVPPSLGACGCAESVGSRVPRDRGARGSTELVGSRVPRDRGALAKAIVRGLKADAAQAATDALAGGLAPLDVVNREIVPALEEVGSGFEKGTLFLPQLLMAADAASAAFTAVRTALAASGRGADQPSRGKVILATVKGDIHDIGKNICRALLENYGFEVIDLGRDVAPARVVESARETGAKLVGLSALMTTTVGFMEETIQALKAAGLTCQTVVGGAVLTAEFAEKIGADFYSKDAIEMVRISEKVYATA